ncbi:hypothetical protein BpHYR1_027438 [Brachionus plicatilis]|uniref:Uncharacterized protein n=1 Tax=Brachionus plicatilis TaxID=10195 RepID=A0A3M7RW73_BRAPC|nr:hypothetical protein BpHYR1_027438 [Brachionus plicatilis]
MDGITLFKKRGCNIERPVTVPVVIFSIFFSTFKEKFKIEIKYCGLYISIPQLFFLNSSSSTFPLRRVEERKRNS